MNTVWIDPRRIIGRRDPRIYGQFIEHFHRQIYGGIYEPGSPLADEGRLRSDVVAAIAEIKPAIVRWPGGCFVSAYHWMDGVGPKREAKYDKAWLVEESNLFGTDEFIDFCRKTGAEPYICTNAGSGTPEEMSDWVEYCNLADSGNWAKLRAKNGHRDPHNVRIWSIGNENYGGWEIGAKTSSEWALFARESAKMMRAVDPTIELSAASVTDVAWNISLLSEAGDLLDWISIHKYWDKCWEDNSLSSYEACMGYTLDVGPTIEKAEHILGAFGRLGRIKIAFDEWNLRGWYHPRRNPAIADKIRARDDNDLNSSYTMADAVFSACFLNETLRHCNTVKMANFAPAVNARGLIYAHPRGIVLRPTYFVFRLYTGWMGDTVIDSFVESDSHFEAGGEQDPVEVPSLDAVATGSVSGDVQVALVNRNPERASEVVVDTRGFAANGATLRVLAGLSKDSFNDVDRPDTVHIDTMPVARDGTGRLVIELPPHSVSILTLGR